MQLSNPFFTNLFWLTFCGLLLLFLVYRRVINYYRSSKNNFLSYKIKVALRGSYKNSKGVIKTIFTSLYLPSWLSVSFVLICAILLFILIHFIPAANFFKLLAFNESNQYQNLIAIHAGIGTIIFALLIFVAESGFKNDETRDRARILLKESFLFPLAVAEIIGFLIFLWGDINFWAILPPLIVAALTVLSLSRLLLMLLNNSKFDQKRRQLLKDRMKQSVNSSIEVRLGNNILLKEIDRSKIELKYYPWTDSEEKASRYNFYSEKTGVVIDIRINKLNQFAKLVEKEANSQGYSFFKEKAKSEYQGITSGSGTSQASTKRYEQADRQFFYKKLGDEVDPGDEFHKKEGLLLLSVEKKVLKETKNLVKLNRLANAAFVIKQQDSISEEVKKEISGLKDQTIDAINHRKLGKIEELMRTFISVAEAFLESINVLGGGYSYDQAHKERSSLFGGWNEIKWLEDSVRDMLVEATQTHDQEVIGNVAYLPVAIAIRAIKAGDQYVYQEFLNFPSYLYWQALREEKGDVKEFMIDRSWRYLKEMSDFYIEHQLKSKIDDVESVKKYKDFTLPIFAAFQSMLKKSFDERDKKSFNSFITQFLGLFDDFDPINDYPNAEHLRNSLEWAKSAAEQEDIRQSIKLQEAKEEASKEMRLMKQQVIFGLAAWILEQYRKEPTDTTLKDFFEGIKGRLPNTLPELTELLISSRQFKTEDFWNWGNWEMIPDGQVRSIDFSSKLDRLYCVKSLLILQDMTDDAISTVVLPHSRDLAFLAEDREDRNTLIYKLDALVADTATWSFILSKEATDKANVFKGLLSRAKDAQEKQEEEYLETAKIDSEKLTEFKLRVVEEFKTAASLRKIIQACGIYKDRTSERPGEKVNSWGYNQIDEKAAFIKNWHVFYTGWGDNYGNGMAASEDQIIFQQILDGIKSQSTISVVDLVSSVESRISKGDLEHPIIVQTIGRLVEYDHTRKSSAFVDKYRNDHITSKFDDLNSYIGDLRVGEVKVPIFDIFVRDKKLKDKVLILDLMKFGNFFQYSPISKSEDERYKVDIFYIRVTDLNEDEEQRQITISQKPTWLEGIADKDKYLRRRVLVKVFQKFEFKVAEPNSGYCLNVDGSSSVDQEGK